MARESAALFGTLLVLFIHSSLESSSNSTPVSTILTMNTASSTIPTPTPSHSATPSLSVPTPVPSPHTSTHSTPARSHTPHVTPFPTSGPAVNTYILNSTDVSSGNLRVCLFMISSMVVKFEYKTLDDKWASVTVPVGEDASINRNKSHCKLTVCAEPTSATLVIENQGLTLALRFDELESNKHWSYNSTMVNYTVSESRFPNFAHKEFYNKPVSAYSTDSLFDWSVPRLLIPSSYQCQAQSTLNHFNSSVVNNTIRVSVVVTDLHVQAFKFTNDQQFDDTESCYDDRKIVVPVAVGGALGLLAGTVLIVSLLRMCWNKYKERKPAHYQHLSANVDY